VANHLSDKVLHYLALHREGKSIKEIAELCQTTYRIVYSAVYYHINPKYKEIHRKYKKRYYRRMKSIKNGGSSPEDIMNTTSPYIDKLALDLGMKKVDVLVIILKDAVTKVTEHRSDFTTQDKIYIDRGKMMKNIKELIARRNGV
jgi:hypothetical protein